MSCYGVLATIGIATPGVGFQTCLVKASEAQVS